MWFYMKYIVKKITVTEYFWHVSVVVLYDHDHDSSAKFNVIFKLVNYLTKIDRFLQVLRFVIPIIFTR